jgi:hypothetical protein
MRNIFILLFVCLLASCSASKRVVQDEVVISPEWVSARPISSSYYIGIAKASKQSEDYQALAKQNALMDLSSEISVKLSSESIFHQVDKGESYREDYQSLIQIESQKNLEGYTLVGSWENEGEYWLYYQLSKATWEKIQIERKQKAIGEAFSYYQLAINQRAKNEFVASIHYAVKALEALKLYMKEPLFHPSLDQPLDRLCFQFLADAHDSVQYDVETDSKQRTHLVGDDISNALFEASVVAGVPFKVRSSMKGIPAKVISSEDGLLKVNATSVDANKEEHFVQFDLDWARILQEADASSWLRSLLTFPENSFVFEVQIKWPRIAISSAELNLGEAMSQSILLNETKDYLKDKGFEFATEGEADLVIFISANTREGLVSRRMHTALLEYTFTVNDSSGNEIYHEQVRELKGVQASFPTAGVNAYERSLDEFRWEVLRPFVRFLEGI